MKRLSLCLMLALVSLFYTSPVTAQEGLLASPPTPSEDPDARFVHRLLLRRGTMQVSGDLALYGSTTFVPNQRASFGMSLAPWLGFFVLDQFELTLGIDYSAGLQGGDFQSDRLMLFAGGRYVFDLGSILYPYAGLRLGLMLNLYNGNAKPDFYSGVPLGFLLSLNRHVALNLGAVVHYTLDGDTLDSHLAVILGYLGVEGFF